MKSDLKQRTRRKPSNEQLPSPPLADILVEHRRQMRSVLAVIRASVQRTAASAASVDEYVAHLTGRLGAIARVQEILMRGPTALVDLAEILEEEIRSQGVARARIAATSPSLLLDRTVAGSLGLALHELLTNAIKFGALANDRGNLSVSWRAIPDEPGVTLLEWREESLGTVSYGGDSGYGFELIRKTLPYEIGAKTRIELTWRGLECDIAFRAKR